MKKDYDRPEMLVTTIQLGVFGQYGLTDRDEVYALPIPDRRNSSR